MFLNTGKLSFTSIALNHITTYEHITGKIEFIGSEDQYSLTIHAVYRPPTSSSGFNVSEAIHDLNTTFEVLNSEKNILLVGDTKINLKDNNDLNTQRYRELLSTWGLNQGIWDFTREEIRGNNVNQSCIDHIYYRLSKPFNNIFTGIIRSKISDHYNCQHWNTN